MKNTTKKTLLLFLALLFVASGSAQAQFSKKKKWKIGINRFMATSQYTYDSERKSSDTGSIDTAITASDSGQFAATTIMGEYLFFGLLGVEVDFGITPGQRNFSFSTTSKGGSETKIGDVVEKIRPLYLYGANWYFKDHESNGWKMLLGVQTGAFTAEHQYTDGGARSDDTLDDWTGFQSSQTSTIEIPVQIIKLGVDWIRENNGIRFEFLQITGEVQNKTELGRINSSVQQQYETIVLGGGPSIGVFAHF